MKNEIAVMERLDLPAKYEGRVQLCFNAVEQLIPAAEVYLYGDYAENQIFPDSPIKLLVVIGEGCSVREKKTLGWEVEDWVYHISNDAFVLEVKVIEKSLYEGYIEGIGTNKKIRNIRKNLRRIIWIDK